MADEHERLVALELPLHANRPAEVAGHYVRLPRNECCRDALAGAGAISRVEESSRGSGSGGALQTGERHGYWQAMGLPGISRLPWPALLVTTGDCRAACHSGDVHFQFVPP